jgi:hypothetical protein
MYYIVRHDTMFKNLQAFRLMNTIRTGPRKIHLQSIGERKEYAPTWLECLHALLAKDMEAHYAAVA